MGQKCIDKCRLLYEEVLKNKPTRKIRISELRKAISINIGSCKATQEMYLKLLVEFGFLKPVGVGIFEVQDICV